MNSFGPRRSWQNHPPSAQPDLARRAVIGGGALALVLVVLAIAAGFWGGGSSSSDPPLATSSAAALGSDLEPAKSGSDKSDSGKSGKSDSGKSGKSDSGKSGKSDSGKSDSGKSKGKSDSDSDGDSSGSSDTGDSGKSGKKHGSSSSSSSSSSDSGGSGVLAGLGDSFSPGEGSSSRVLPPNFSVPSRRSPTGLNRLPGTATSTDAGFGSSSDSKDRGDSTQSTGSAGGGYARRAGGSTTCTTVVSDRAGLDRELQSAGPDEVVCIRGSSRASSGSGGLPGGFGRSVSDPGRTSPYVTRTSGPSGSRTTSSYVGPGQSSGSISLGSGPGSGSGDGGKCTQEVTDSAGFERALKGARDGDKVCVGVGDLGVRLEVSKGGISGLSIQIAGLGALSSEGFTVQADDVQAEHNNIGRVTR